MPGSSEAQKRASAKYDAANTVQFKIKLNKNNDGDMIDYLKGLDNRQGHLKALIREDMEKNGR